MLAPEPAYAHAGAIAPKLAGGAPGSSSQLVCVTPKLGSLAETVACTAVTYQPFLPFGVAGLSAIDVDGGGGEKVTATCCVVARPSAPDATTVIVLDPGASD